MKYCSKCGRQFAEYICCPFDGITLAPLLDVPAIAGRGGGGALAFTLPRGGFLRTSLEASIPPFLSQHQGELLAMGTKDEFQRQLSAEKVRADNDLRKQAAQALLCLFGLSMILGYAIILGLGIGILVLPPALIATVLGATVTAVAVFYKRVICVLFPLTPVRSRRGRHTRQPLEGSVVDVAVFSAPRKHPSMAAPARQPFGT